MNARIHSHFKHVNKVNFQSTSKSLFSKMLNYHFQIIEIKSCSSIKILWKTQNRDDRNSVTFSTLISSHECATIWSHHGIHPHHVHKTGPPDHGGEHTKLWTMENFSIYNMIIAGISYSVESSVVQPMSPVEEMNASSKVISLPYKHLVLKVWAACPKF